MANKHQPLESSKVVFWGFLLILLFMFMMYLTSCKSDEQPEPTPIEFKAATELFINAPTKRVEITGIVVYTNVTRGTSDTTEVDTIVGIGDAYLRYDFTIIAAPHDRIERSYLLKLDGGEIFIKSVFTFDTQSTETVINSCPSYCYIGRWGYYIVEWN